MSISKITYTQRINTIFTYINNNLESDLSLETIAKIANYSPYHFHRIFKTITKEPLNSYINRKRLEKAAGLLYRNHNYLSLIFIYNVVLVMLHLLQNRLKNTMKSIHQSLEK